MKKKVGLDHHHQKEVGSKLEVSTMEKKVGSKLEVSTMVWPSRGEKVGRDLGPRKIVATVWSPPRRKKKLSRGPPRGREKKSHDDLIVATEKKVSHTQPDFFARGPF